MKKSPSRKERRAEIQGKPSLLATYNTKPDPVIAAQVSAERMKRNPDNLTNKALARKRAAEKLKHSIDVRQGRGEV